MSVLFLLAAVFIVVALWENAEYVIPLCGIFLFPMLVLEIYCETWQICFGERICKKVLFCTRTHEWRELKEAKKYYSLSESDVTVTLIFTDGKSFRFRLKDQNAEKAEKIILTHCNIKTQT